MQELRYFLLAVQYFTRVPIPAWVTREFDAAWLASAARYFPLVGALIGVVAGAFYFVASGVLGALSSAVLTCALTVWITGAFHEDGLADTCDALGGTVSRERALEIMKDSRIGTYGAVALVLALTLKIALLAELSVEAGAAALVAAHALSRALAISLVAVLPYAGDAAHSKARPLALQLSPASLSVALLFGIAPWLLFAFFDDFSFAWLAALAASVLAAVACWRWFKRRLGGFTGDTLGACQQLCELAFYLGLSLQFQ
jgi:adenosylcobinamide-GDP ribazoletransferase